MSTFFSYVLKPKFSSHPISPVPLGQLALKKERKKEVKKAHWVCQEILQLMCTKLVGGGGGIMVYQCVVHIVSQKY